MKFRLSHAFVFLVMTCFAFAARSEPARDFTLKNGMKIIVKEDHRAPTVVHMIWYKAGSMDEVDGTTGVAHVLEHMMFKGTKTLKAEEFSKRVAAMGGEDNAFTTSDYTAYFEQIGKSHLEAMMTLEADRMADLSLRADEFASEIKVIMEERRWRTDDQPTAQVLEALDAAAYVAHPYHHPVIGWMDDIQHMTVEDARNWYDAWYAPNNATMIVVGDVDAKEVFALAEKHFGGIPSKTLPMLKPRNEPAQQGIRRTAVKAPAENPLIVLAFKAPALRDVEKDADPYALEVLAAVLDGYDNARLNARLVRSARVAVSAGADYSDIARGPSLFMLEGVPVPGVSPEALEQRLRAEVAKVAKDGISEQELKRVKAQLVAEQVYKRDSIFGQAMEIGTMEMSGLSHKNIDRVIEKLGQVTSRQVQEVARKYFGDDGLTVGKLVPLPLEGKKPEPPPAGLLR